MSRFILTSLSIALSALLLLGPRPASAGDLAGHQAIGFSPDASHFAFMSFGAQDGSGAAYANLYILDLAADRYVGGSPFRVGGREGDGESISEAMAKAGAEAADALSTFDIRHPALLAAAASPLQQGIDHQSVNFDSIKVVPSISWAKPITLSLETFPLPPPFDFCPQPDNSRGYAARLTIDGATTEIHRDAAIPESRGCALDYQIGAIWLPMNIRTNNAVALISVLSSGFEGQYDRRFAAIPLILPSWEEMRD